MFAVLSVCTKRRLSLPSQLGDSFEGILAVCSSSYSIEEAVVIMMFTINLTLREGFGGAVQSCSVI